jgi:hypothetical protein
MPEGTNVQLAFHGGPNPSAAPQLLADNEVATATNIDFGFEQGGAATRRGATLRHSVGAAQINYITRRRTNWQSYNPLYVACGSTVYRGSSGVFTSVLSGLSGPRIGITHYRDATWIAPELGTQAIKDNGTSIIEWVKQSPQHAVAIDAQYAHTDFATTTQTAIVGTSGTSTGWFTSGIGPYDVEIVMTMTNTNLSTHASSLVVGTGGKVEFEFIVDQPSYVTSIDAIFSVGNDTFSTTLGVAGVSPVWDNSDGLLSIRVSDFTPTGSWTNLPAAKLTFHAVGPITVNWWAARIVGAEDFAVLTDTDVGYTYYQTWANIDSDNNITEESRPGPEAHVYLSEGAVTLTATDTPSGGAHGITHRVFYRAGGALDRPYEIGRVALATTTLLDTKSDLDAATDGALLQTLDVLPHDWFPNNVVAVSEPFFDRLFIAHENRINWTLPGNPSALPEDSFADVSHKGDEITGLVVYPSSLVIVNQESVYELRGNVFEGENADWVLSHTASRHGNCAYNAVIKTPYGVPLLDNDGLSMYSPGQGIDVPLEWVMDKIGDAWRGMLASDPAGAKGNRVPAINLGYQSTACATFADNKLYLGLPTNGATTPNTIFILDFLAKQTYWYIMPWNFTYLWWDAYEACLMIGTTNGKIMELDGGPRDQTTTGTPTNMAWSVRTKAWTVAADTVLENISVEHRGGPAKLVGIYDGTTTATLGTLTNATRGWSTPALGGTICNSVVFELSGTQASNQQTSLYNIAWDALYEPRRVSFYKTDYDLNNYEWEKLWDVHYSDIEAFGFGTVAGTMFVDGTAVSTFTIASPTNKRLVTPTSFPAETYGYQAYTVYVASEGVIFKHWDTRRDARNEPPRVNIWRTDVQSSEESINDGVDFDVNANGIMLATTFVDNVAVATHTVVGFARQSYAFSLPPETYGRTVYTVYTGTAFKHYSTWYHQRREPDRVAQVQYGPVAFGSDQTLKTWVAELNPCGYATGVLYADGTAISTATFVGTRHSTFHVGVDFTPAVAPQKAIDLRVVYTALTVLKHYDTKFETEAQPFGKTSWLIRYNKLGGASACDLARQFDLDVEVTGTATLTSYWDVDGATLATNTLTFTGRQWEDAIAFPPGLRGFNFQQRIVATMPFKVWKSSLDLLRVGLKGLGRITIPGTPING